MPGAREAIQFLVLVGVRWEEINIRKDTMCWAQSDPREKGGCG